MLMPREREDAALKAQEIKKIPDYFFRLLSTGDSSQGYSRRYLHAGQINLSQVDKGLAASTESGLRQPTLTRIQHRGHHTGSAAFKRRVPTGWEKSRADRVGSGKYGGSTGSRRGWIVRRSAHAQGNHRLTGGAADQQCCRHA